MSAIAAAPGLTLKRIVRIDASGTYTPQPGTKAIKVFCAGAGGGGGGIHGGGTNGGNTWFGNALRANGGEGGYAATSGGPGVNPGTGQNGDVNITGGGAPGGIGGKTNSVSGQDGAPGGLAIKWIITSRLALMAQVAPGII